jgi:hypothetical protein
MKAFRENKVKKFYMALISGKYAEFQKRKKLLIILPERKQM